MLFQNYTNAQGPAQFQAFLTMTSLAMQGLLGPRGQVFWVDSAHPNTSTDGGRQPNYPTTKIRYALNLCESGRGDVIVVAATHSENWSAVSPYPNEAPLFDKNNVTIYTQPGGAVTFGGTNDTVTATITANDVRIIGLQLNCNNAGLDAMISIAGSKRTTIDSCIFTQSTTQNVDAYITLNASTDTVIRNCKCHAPTATNSSGSFVEFLGTPIRPLIEGNLITGLFSNACIYAANNIGATAFTIRGNHMMNLHASEPCIDFEYNNAAVVGQINNNFVNCVLAAAATRTAIAVGATAVVYISQNFGHDGVGLDSGLLNPVADS